MSLKLPPGVPLSQIPAGVPPKGVTPDFVNHPSLERLVIGIGAVMTALTLCFVATRVSLALESKHRLVLDECTHLGTSLEY